MKGIFSRVRSLLASGGEGPSLQKRIDRIEDFRGWSYAKVLSVIGRREDSFLNDGGQRLRIWREERYSITLLFDDSDLCLGVEEERNERITGGKK